MSSNPLERGIQSSIWMPTVIETTPRGDREWTVFSRLLKDRIVFLGSFIEDDLANILIAQLLFLESEDAEKDVFLYVNCPGGLYSSGLAVYDTMQHVRCPITTLCVGQAVDVAALLLAAGTHGKRFALPHSRVLLHQPFGGFSGQAMDIDIRAKEIGRVKRELNQIISTHSRQPLERVEQDTDREFFLSAEEALAYGLIDQVIEPRKSVPVASAVERKE